MAQCSRMSETQKTSRQKHKQKHNQKATKSQLRTKWHISTPNSEHEVWSFHTTIIRLKMVTCFAYVTISEAACASQRLHTRSCGHAMCLLGLFFPVISHLCVQSWVLATIFAIALSFVLLLFMPVMQVCPFVATCVAKSSCTQPKFCHWICRVFASVFCHNCCHYRCPCRFFVIHVALKIATAIVSALEVAMVVAIKFRRLIEHYSWILDELWLSTNKAHIKIAATKNFANQATESLAENIGSCAICIAIPLGSQNKGKTAEGSGYGLKGPENCGCWKGFDILMCQGVCTCGISSRCRACLVRLIGTGTPKCR